jgi:small subunit ribosomal protein S8
MVMTDSIADMLTRIRNAQMAMKKTVDVPYSNFKRDIVKVLRQEGFIAGFDIRLQNGKKVLRVYLKYTEDKTPVIQGIERVSRPGRRRYVGYKKFPYVHDGLGMSIISTSQGLLTTAKAKRKRVGGEVILNIW